MKSWNTREGLNLKSANHGYETPALGKSHVALLLG
jgi:hypothetical protein